AEIVTTPSATEGHRKRPRSSRFTNRHAPSPSCQISLIRSPLRPPEDPQIAGMRIALEPLLHHERQRAEPLAHIRVPGRKPHPSPARKRDHLQRSRAVSAPITFASVAESGAPSIVRRTCSPKATVIEHDGAGGGGAQIGAVAGAASFSSEKTRT